MDLLTLRMILGTIFWLAIVFGSILILNVKYGSNGSTIGAGSWIIITGLLFIVIGLVEGEDDIFSVFFAPIILIIIGSGLMVRGYRGLRSDRTSDLNKNKTN
jgi:hypothetical protein